ncbi:His-Xaa-Ser system radical SAM maturase HxsB [Achromobacter mucicolens]|uniref:His-Xaa-Ser system radical SAM maturase HxsB n=1 Tax=Achromobacter mucicolens TaxID=1389922 RepID=UPI000D34AF38|nr:His-Xaa-Ser system radical SAM maturase HxsB [Achromobacter mucicolens]PTX05513.1 His-Xaa-Ser system radical SAM maturase HxsB [Achromobacter mucicolens]
MNAYPAEILPFQIRLIGDNRVAISGSGDYLFLSVEHAQLLMSGRISQLPLPLQADLKAGFFIGSRDGLGSRRLLVSRQSARRETVTGGASLHVIVPTLLCEHSCQYCQVSRSLSDSGYSMSQTDLFAACDSVFESEAQALTVEFQGGDPLLRFDLVEAAIRRIHDRNATEKRALRFVIASTLHQLTPEICDFLAKYGVFLSTSIDGPAKLHNRNRPCSGRNAYERTLEGIKLARAKLGHDAVSALMTTTKASLSYPEAIVDEYVDLGFQDVFIRPLSSYGFAKRNQTLLGYRPEQFSAFYTRALDRVLHWNRKGVELREVYASIILNKILSPFDSGYVDLQSPTGAGQSVLVYNYDGYVYPSDEARMLAETGDTSFRLGPIGSGMSTIQRSGVFQRMVNASLVERMEGCQTCAYQNFCAPNPVDAQAQFGNMETPSVETEHCHRHQWLFDYFFTLLKDADGDLLDLFHAWAQPAGTPEN